MGYRDTYLEAEVSWTGSGHLEGRRCAVDPAWRTEDLFGHLGERMLGKRIDREGRGRG
jgi:hypothetical protein